MKRHPTAQEIVDNCNMDNIKFAVWYNFRLKELNRMHLRLRI